MKGFLSSWWFSLWPMVLFFVLGLAIILAFPGCAAGKTEVETYRRWITVIPMDNGDLCYLYNSNISCVRH